MFNPAFVRLHSRNFLFNTQPLAAHIFESVGYSVQIQPLPLSNMELWQILILLGANFDSQTPRFLDQCRHLCGVLFD